MQKIYLAILLCLAMSGCDKKTETEVAPVASSSASAAPAPRPVFAGNLVVDWINSPEDFFNETVNGRAGFTQELEPISDGVYKQAIANSNMSLIMVNTWHKQGNRWRCVEASMQTLLSVIDSDSNQVALRWFVRFKDDHLIMKAANSNSRVVLPSGAVAEGWIRDNVRMIQVN